MKSFIRIVIALVMIGIFIVMFFIAKGYAYVESMEINILNDNDEYVIVEPYEYDISKIRQYFALTNLYIGKNKELDLSCKYKIVINEKDIICYDKGNYATLSIRKETIADIKQKVKEKDLDAEAKAKYKTKTIKLNKDFIKLLKNLGE